MEPEDVRTTLKAIAKLVAQGRAEYVVIDGKPGVRITEKGRKWLDRQTQTS